MRIRTYLPEDLSALYDICLRTGWNGEDASGRCQDPRLLGHVYAAPYGVLEPETCLVLEDAQGVCGYVLGTVDSVGFQQRTEAAWWPSLRQQYPLPPETDQGLDAGLIRIIHQGLEVGPEAGEHPAHLHIDLLPRAQGTGQGRKLMERFLQLLQEREVPGVHLGVARDNLRAIGYYQKMGFQELSVHPGAVVFGMRFGSA